MLGILSDSERIIEALEQYRKAPGFSDNPNYFYINPLNFPSTLSHIYQVSINYIGKNVFNDMEEILGYYTTKEKADEYVIMFKKKFDIYKNIIEVNEVMVGRLEWLQGFNSEN